MDWPHSILCCFYIHVCTSLHKVHVCVCVSHIHEKMKKRVTRQSSVHFDVGRPTSLYDPHSPKSEASHKPTLPSWSVSRASSKKISASEQWPRLLYNIVDAEVKETRIVDAEVKWDWSKFQIWHLAAIIVQFLSFNGVSS